MHPGSAKSPIRNHTNIHAHHVTFLTKSHFPVCEVAGLVGSTKRPKMEQDQKSDKWNAYSGWMLLVHRIPVGISNGAMVSRYPTVEYLNSALISTCQHSRA